MLEIKNISVSFKDKNVLQNLNLEIEEGIILGILGKNGAGKTTLFESLYQSQKYNGEILWQNQKLLRKNISYLETENYFYPYITGREYLSYFSKDRLPKTIELAEKFQLPLDKFVQYYSSGMKKKLALIGMLMLDKPINILDEPFNGVDFEGVHLLYDIIRELKQSNKMVIISSHIIETLFHTCDRIVTLENGLISNIFEKSEFEKLNHFKFV
ncbi:ATP-binding cassette domain-containing protein [Chryseobacterium balustinum]|jgi:ABC-2 type transport system ATP-binding protein|uniref:ABC-2 type transport system ATP-binding protein n=1 Tax=Chryseobacterium balustinum TaxID=246 RepID=A0AAX2IPF7_9FLAO|nr:ATP-binding cassette domain-containing protein [Chryseobacterium balustinum]AZB30015.1 ABC transporter ATP-binding protein [Chryseobacterium balustinum]SKC04912.1 ABC-2 type transport system ATP-binding protein [Chryseobacterium balustinum]SQA91712.1 ABC-type transporter ATP-binding protein EcsA [Chryseobacterium balustinum]